MVQALHMMLGQLAQIGQGKGQTVDAGRRRSVVKAAIGDELARIIDVIAE